MIGKKLAITIDLEDWFQVETLRERFPVKSWSTDYVRFQEPLERLLRIFDAFEIKATFFVLGWIAERYPGLIKLINNAGHEIASHGMSHVMNSLSTDEEILDELIDSKKLLEDIIGKEVIGYRAPSFSISDNVLKMIAVAGYKYDSSYFPFSMNKKYGKLSMSSRKETLPNGLIEFSIPMASFFGKNIPFAGGAYFRFLPIWLFKKLLTRANSDIVVLYFHPWEFDPDQPKVSELKLRSKIRHYYGLTRNLRKMEKTLFFAKKESMRFYTLKKYLESMELEINYPEKVR